MESAEIDVKKRLLLAAKKLFSRHGFDGTSIRQICEEAGANVALVSYYFGGKENMFKAMFDMSFPQRMIREMFRDPIDPVEGIRMMVREVLRYQARDREMMRVIQREMGSPSRAEVIRGYLRPVWQKARSLLEAGRQQGVFRFRSLDSTFLYIWGGLLFPRDFDIFEPLLTEPKPTLEEKIEELTSFVLGALGCEVEHGVKVQL